MDALFSDFDSMSESSSTDQDDVESLYGGHARSILFNLEESIKKIDNYLSFERAFLFGDIVRLVSDSSGPMGKVVDVDITVDLESIYGRKIQNVSSGCLQKIHSISVGDYVVSGGWLGKAEKIVKHVTVQFDNGMKVQLTAGGPEKMISLSPDSMEDPPDPFYPGQRIQVEFSSVSKPVIWLWGTKNGKTENGTVCNVETGLVYVDWLGCAVKNCDKETAPPCLQDSKNLSLLPCFPNANWQIGDWCILPMVHVSPNDSTFGMVHESEKSDMVIHRSDTELNFENVAVIVKTKARVNVQWQDGSQSLRLDSHLLCPVNIVDVHDFWPDGFVLEKGMIGSPTLGDERWGVVKFVDSKEQTVMVKWWKSSSDLLNSDKLIEETVSAYELIEHPQFSFCLGEAVFRVDHSIVNQSGGSCVKNNTISKTEELVTKAVENVGDWTENVKEKFLSDIGIVVGFKNGHVEVQWASGSTSKVAPYEICGVDNEEDASDTSTLDEENVHLPDDDTFYKENQSLSQNVKDLSGVRHYDAKESNSPSLFNLAIGFFTSITSRLFWPVVTMLASQNGSTSDGEQILGKGPEDYALELHNLNPVVQPWIDDFHESISSGLVEVAPEDITVKSSSVKPEIFYQFDVVMDCSDHYFAGMGGVERLSPQVNRGWLKRVHRDWNMLKNDLPETIYVRVYEDRMDLLRASIVGTAGTPYHDGLFFFDIHLPPQYPNDPPMVFYHSGGLRINPNLYETGKVCLSLLNTWTGSDHEVWNPEASSLLQVLLSLQALVLNEKPYFNEAGYDSQLGKPDGERNSVKYNENVFLVSCRSMLYSLHKPPKHFEALVDAHFGLKCRDILSSCKAYMNGAPIGHPFINNSEPENRQGCSTGFKIMLQKLIPLLVQAFSERGFDCTCQVP